MQLLPGLYLLNGFAYATHANFYLLRSDEGNVLIDSGTFPEDLERAEQQLAVWGLDLESVDHLLLTHAHYDHVANAAALLTLHAGAAGVSQFVDTAVARSGRKPSLGQSEAPTALHGADVRSLFETAAPPPCQAQAPAPVGISWTAPHPTARRPEVIR